MSYSLNEIEAIAKRAARGAGMPWGLAEEAAMAVRWLASYGLDGPELLASSLSHWNKSSVADASPNTDGVVWSCSNETLHPIVAGAALSDAADRLKHEPMITLEHVTHPLLLLPFTAGAARQISSTVSLEWDGVKVVSNGESLCIKGTTDALNVGAETTVIVRANSSMGAPVYPKTRGDMTDECLANLSHFAMQGFAPATDESRKLGAGAGLTDND